jgi:hypothetical protein
VSHTPHHTPQVCTHERGVGTAICLHCRKESRIASRERRRRLMLRGAAGAIVVATGLAASALGATALRDRRAAARTTAAAPDAQSASATAPVTARPDSGSSAALVTTPRPVAAVAPALLPEKRSVPLSPILPMGNSTLADGVGAFRSDSGVTLSFDMPMTRTRRPEKFELFVRGTLPAIYGPKIDSALAKMPAGSFAHQGDLTSELPTRGLRIPVDSAWNVVVYPETRKGVDGPLVVRYRTVTATR